MQKMVVTSSGKFDMIKNKTIARIFNELDAYRAFCVEYGHVFNERDLGKRNSFSYAQFERARRGDSVVDRWAEDAGQPTRKASVN